MRKQLFLAAAMVMPVLGVHAQRVMDKLDRGLVAVAANNGTFVSWRVLGEDGDNVKFNLYRDGTLLNSTPLSVSNFSDASGSASSRYVVKTVVDGVEKETSKQSLTSANDYFEIKIAPVPSNADGRDISSDYEPNDATVADLDGDGQMEILLKLRNTKFNYTAENTDYDIIQVYKLDGTLMWWIDGGPYMMDFQSNEFNIAAYDWDLDGKAECVLRAADNTVIHKADGSKQVIGDPNNTKGQYGTGGGGFFTNGGAEYLLYLNGETGEPYQVKEYPLKRFEAGESNLQAAWGDGYGHRSSKHFFGAPYFDGRQPSIFLARGIYTRHKMIAYDVNPVTHELIERWRWFNNTPGPWYGQGYHNYSVADVDWDGRDEIVFGSMVIDDNGLGLSTTGLGHGDSHHVGDLNPYIYGQEVVACNEDLPNNNYRDATTSKIYYRTTATSDDGRAIAGNFSNEYPGSQFITSHDSESLISTVTNGHLAGASPTNDVAQNFRIFWDGDLLDETFNYSNGKNTAGAVYKFRHGAIKTFTGTATNNDTKGTPCFQGDIFGDWREEVILRAADNRSIRIYTTTIPTEYRIYTLLHDPQYRNAMVWQMNGYNQTPHVSYFLGELEGITQAPPSPTMNGRDELAAGGTLSTSDYGKSVVFAATENATATVAEGAAPTLFVDNAPTWVQGHGDNDNITTETYTHTLQGGGFGGATKIVKLGGGKLILPAVQQKHTGKTEVWFGTLAFNGEMTGSRVWLNRLTALESDGGRFNKGIEMNYGAELRIGSDAKASEITTSDLVLNFGSKLCLDIFADGTTADRVNATALTIEKKTWENGPEYNTPVIVFTPHYAAGATKLPGGSYLLGTIGSVTGNLSDLAIEGLNGQKVSLVLGNGKLYLNVSDSRDATDVVWTGANGSAWNTGDTPNFKVQATGEETGFVSGDRVIFDDNSVNTNVEIPANIFPSKIVFNNSSKDYVISGAGFDGNVDIEKKGTGKVTLKNTSTFTGTIQINNGTLEVAALGANEGAVTGALGQYANTITLNNGGVLSVTATGKMSHPVEAKEGSISVAKGATLTIVGNSVTGNGTLVKAGDGQLNFQVANKIKTLRIDAGKVYDEREDHTNTAKIANNIVFNGKNVEMQYLNSIYSYSNNNTNFEVVDGATGTLTLDGRCNYTGTLTGKGQLTVVASYVRNTLSGNWSAFEGTLVAKQLQNSSFDFYSIGHLDKATLEIYTGSTFTNTNESNYTRNDKMKLGALKGGGTLGGTGTYYVGCKGLSTSFTGTFGSGINIVKEGTGTLTLSKVQPDMGTFALEAGEVLFSFSSEPAASVTGTQPLVVKGVLSGTGVFGNPTVTFELGSAMTPKTRVARNTYRQMKFNGDVVINDGAAVNLEIENNSNKYSNFVVEGNLQNNGSVNVTLNSKYVPALGDEFELWTAGSSSTTPRLYLPALPDGLAWDKSGITPTRGLLKVTDAAGINDIDADKIVRCIVVTVDGIVVKDFTAPAAEVMANCNDLANGVYVINMTAEGFNQTQKIVINK